MEKDTASVGAQGYSTVEVEIPQPETVSEFEGLVDDVESDVPALAFRAYRVSLQSALRPRLKKLQDEQGLDGDELAQEIQSAADNYVYGQRPTASKGTIDAEDLGPEAESEEGRALLERLSEKGYDVKGIGEEEAAE